MSHCGCGGHHHHTNQHAVKEEFSIGEMVELTEEFEGHLAGEMGQILEIRDNKARIKFPGDEREHWLELAV